MGRTVKDRRDNGYEILKARKKRQPYVRRKFANADWDYDDEEIELLEKYNLYNKNRPLCQHKLFDD